MKYENREKENNRFKKSYHKTENQKTNVRHTHTHTQLQSEFRLCDERCCIESCNLRNASCALANDD